MSKVMMIGFDGADPYVVKRMVAEGRLPNFKKIAEMGVTTEDYDMLGSFPSVTPPNWATIATGNWPISHGITDFWNHTLGKTLELVENNWDSRRFETELIWETAVKAGKRSLVLNYCGAWPPRFPSDKLVMIDGTSTIPLMRAYLDGQKVLTLKKGDFKITLQGKEVENTSDDCIVTKEQIALFGKADENALAQTDEFGAQFDPLYDRDVLIMDDILVQGMKQKKALGGTDADKMESPLKAPEGWSIALDESALAAVVPLNNGLVRRYAVVTANEEGKYDTLSWYDSRKNETPMATLKVGEWSDFIYDEYFENDEKVKVAYKLRLMHLAEDGSECKIFYTNATNMENYDYFYPQEMAEAMYKEIGPLTPMARFTEPDFPVLADEIAMESFDMIFDWHIDATNYMMDAYPDWELFYTHIHPQDLVNHFFIDRAIPGTDDNWETFKGYIEELYEMEDRYLGAMLERLDENTSIVVTSDHGAVPKGVGVESAEFSSGQGIVLNVMEKLGYTKSYRVPGERFAKIDWSQTRAVIQRGNYIYVNLKGREPYGIVEPEDYDKLIEDIISDLYAYRDPHTGRRVVSFCLDREEMKQIGMGGPHVGDIFVQQQCCFIDQHNGAPTTCTNEGYSLNNLFMMAGAGIKEGVVLTRPVRANEIVPTICELMESPMCAGAEGGPIYQGMLKYNM